MDLEKKKDKFRGCLIGGAAGDALGYPVEFMKKKEIIKKYGVNGITEYDCAMDGKAWISDDTQMTLFTAEGLLQGKEKYGKQCEPENFTAEIAKSYRDWYCTQYNKYMADSWLSKQSRLLDVPELYAWRAPGNTCLAAIGRASYYGTMEKPINNSKGCGGIMRVAPIGLFFDTEKDGDSAETAELTGRIDRLGAMASAVTHGHELGYIPAAAFVDIIWRLSHKENISVLDAVMDMKQEMQRQFPNAVHLPEMLTLTDRAVELSQTNISDQSAIRILGGGWVAEETLAIALYCALKYENDFDRALTASVNHDGDSDSTGAVTGNILGAYLGFSGIPEKYTKNLELKDLILEMADALC